jgi:hypothetical protein
MNKFYNKKNDENMKNIVCINYLYNLVRQQKYK